jgi:hypothetical protein
MNWIKTATISLFAIVALSANAENFAGFKSTTLLNGGTNRVLAVSTNSLLTIAVPKSEELTLYIEYKYHAAPGAGDPTSLSIPVYRGIDGGGYESTAWFTWVPAGNSTTTNIVVTNITVSSISALQCRLINYGTNAIATNVFFKYGFKN